MARPEKHTADYFPFYVKDGRTLFILEQKYQCKGTGFFTNVLRFLCDTPDHHYCIKTESDRMYFFSKVKCDEQSGLDMLNIMSKTGKILSQWWVSDMVIYSPDLINSIKDAYRNRRNTLLTQDQIGVIYTTNLPSSEFLTSETPPSNGINDADNPQKRKEKKRKNNPLTPLTQLEQDLFNRFWKAYPKRKAKPRAERAFLKAGPDELLVVQMTAMIEKAKTSEDWTRENGKYIPLPATWLNDRRWEDEDVAHGNGKQKESPYTFCPNKSCGKEVLKEHIEGEYCIHCVPRKPLSEIFAKAGVVNAAK